MRGPRARGAGAGGPPRGGSEGGVTLTDVWCFEVLQARPALPSGVVERLPAWRSIHDREILRLALPAFGALGYPTAELA